MGCSRRHQHCARLRWRWPWRYALRPARGGHGGHGLALLCAGVLGALVTLGWWVATELALDSFDPVPLAWLSFIGPVAGALLTISLLNRSTPPQRDGFATT